MTAPYSQLTPDQLHSALSERDDQLRVALVEVEKWKESVTAVALASQEVEESLKTVLKECVSLLEKNSSHHGETALWSKDEGTNRAAWLIQDNDRFIAGQINPLLEKEL